jgi:hypothetical protein
VERELIQENSSQTRQIPRRTKGIAEASALFLGKSAFVRHGHRQL